MYVLDVDTTTSRMALGLSPPEEGPPQQFKEARQQIKDPARARKADKSDRSEPRTQKATATLGSKSSKRKAKSLSGGMSALGSALAMAGFKGRAQLDKEAKSESKATGSAGETALPSSVCTSHSLGQIESMTKSKQPVLLPLLSFCKGWPTHMLMNPFDWLYSDARPVIQYSVFTRSCY